MPKCVDCKHYINKRCDKIFGWNMSAIENTDSRCKLGFEPKQPNPESEPAQIRQFETGAYRDNDTDKLDFEACFSPLVLQRYAEYIRSKRKVPIWKDSGIRPDDNWQMGISVESYMKSKARHFISTWLIHRGFSSENIEETLCAELFNTMGYLFEILKKKSEEK